MPELLPPQKPTTIQELCDAIAAAHAHGRTLRIQGSNSTPAAHAPTAPDAIIQPLILQRLNKFLEVDRSLHAVHVDAGFTFDALQQQLAYRGYWLPIDPSAPNGRPPIHRTLGGLIATDSAGPLRTLRGGWPALILNLTAVTPTGHLFETTNLHDPNIAALARLTIRIIPPPADERALLIFCEDLDRLAYLLAALHTLPERPAYLQLANSVVLEKNPLTLPIAPFILIAGFLGAADRNAARLETARTLAAAAPGESLSLAAAPAGRLRHLLSSEPAGPTSFRLTPAPNSLLPLLQHLLAADPRAWVVADLLSHSLRGTTQLPAGQLPATTSNAILHTNPT